MYLLRYIYELNLTFNSNLYCQFEISQALILEWLLIKNKTNNTSTSKFFQIQIYIMYIYKSQRLNAFLFANASNNWVFDKDYKICFKISSLKQSIYLYYKGSGLHAISTHQYIHQYSHYKSIEFKCDAIKKAFEIV